MPVSLILPPVAAPVSLDEVKRHLRVETDDDDQYLDELIAFSLNHLEAVTGLKLITQHWRQYLDEIPKSGEIRLAVEPVQSLAAMRIFDGDGNAVSLALSSLVLDRISSPPRLQMSRTVRTDYAPNAKAANGIEIDIIAGFGDSAVDVPDGLRRALLLLIAHAYEFRGAVPVSAQPASEPHGFRALIAPFRRMAL